MKPCKVFSIVDLHYQKTTVPEDANNIPNIVNHARESKPDFIVILGDSLDDHEKVDVQAQNNLCKLLKKLRTIARVYILVGNHDYINNKQFLSKQHCLNVFKCWKGVCVVDKPIIRKIRGRTFVFVPYTEPGRFIEALDTLFDQGDVWELADAIFCHQEIKGVSLNERNKVSTRGDVWSKKYPPLFSGHIHKEQIIKNVHYPGSSKQVNFGELEDKFIWDVVFEDEETPSITKIKINSTSKKVIACSIEETKELEEGEDTKLVVSGTPEELIAFKKTKQKELEEKGYVVHTQTKSDKQLEPKSLETIVGGVSFMDGFEALMKKEGGHAYNAYLKVFGAA